MGREDGRKYSVRRLFVFSLLFLLMMGSISTCRTHAAQKKYDEKVKTIRWKARLRDDLKIKKDGKKVTLKKGKSVVVVRRRFSASGNTNKSVILVDGKKYNVSNRYLLYIKDLCTVVKAGDYSRKTKEDYVNQRVFPSKTKYLIWISLDKQRVNIFTGPKSGGEWTLDKVFKCSTGKAETPTTPHFNAEMSFKARTYTYFKTGGTLHYFCEISGNGMHAWCGGGRSRLGKHTVSNGCVRLSSKNAKWIFDNVPVKTRIVLW